MSLPSWQLKSLHRPARTASDKTRARSQTVPMAHPHNCNKASIWLEAQLIHRVEQGDQEAFITLYDSYSKTFYSLAVHILGDRNVAGEALRLVFLKIWEEAHSFDETTDNPFGWALTMMRHYVIDQLRLRSRTPRLNYKADASADYAIGEDVTLQRTQVLSNQASPIHAVMNELPHNQRHSIELAFFKGLTLNEIAEELKQPPLTIRQCIRNGMMHLLESVERHHN